MTVPVFHSTHLSSFAHLYPLWDGRPSRVIPHSAAKGAKQDPQWALTTANLARKTCSRSAKPPCPLRESWSQKQRTATEAPMPTCPVRSFGRRPNFSFSRVFHVPSMHRLFPFSRGPSATQSDPSRQHGGCFYQLSAPGTQQIPRDICSSPCITFTGSRLLPAYLPSWLRLEILPQSASLTRSSPLSALFR